MTKKIKIEVGDITQFDGEAIVNAANPGLLPGNGVCGAIHKQAGIGLEVACNKATENWTKKFPWGHVEVTPGFKLPAKTVLHAVGPDTRKLPPGEEDELLRKCYRNILYTCSDLNIETVAIPAISTGIYGFPLERATQIAIETIRDRIDPHYRPEVTFMCFDEKTAEVYRRLLNP